MTYFNSFIIIFLFAFVVSVWCGYGLIRGLWFMFVSAWCSFGFIRGLCLFQYGAVMG